ncbi:MAG: hypothetical protein KDB85_13305 [Chitinophagales bacterium]|nr:hypothetical protein [Chitinophagales bacterium]HPR30393.1 hypothetical protein [Chitinophagales bacterium]
MRQTKGLWLSLVLLLTATMNTLAQDSVTNSLSMQYGISHLQRQDLNLSPFIHTGISPVNVLLGWDRSANLEQRLTVRFNMINTKVEYPFTYSSPYDDDEHTTLPHLFLFLDVNYRLGKVLKESGPWTLGAGGQWRDRLQIAYYQFALYGQTSYYFTFGLDAWAFARYQIDEKQGLEAELTFPLASWVCRSPYLSLDDQYIYNNYDHSGFKALYNYISQGQLESWGSSQILDLEADYHYMLNEKWELAASWLFSMNLNQDPRPFTSFENGLYFGAVYQF